MKIKVIKGTKQIGGCITLIATAKTKIVIDFGEDLDEEKRTTLDKEELKKEIEGTKAVFITHSHGDHVGLVNLIPEDTRVFMEEMTKRIVEVSADFGINERLTRPVETFSLNKDKKTEPITIGDIKVTPYIVDHSSYNSCMFLIEAEGKKVLHTGDYRNHGRKGKLFESTLKSIENVDCLITEGTTLSRQEKTKYKSEFTLEKDARELFKNYDQVFVLASSTNIDRIVTFYKAKENKKVVFDTFTAAITSAIDFKINEHTEGVYRWNPIRYNRTKTQEFKNRYMTNSYDYGFLPNYIMFIKPSMLLDIRKLKKEGLITKGCLIYSMWNGYIEKDVKLKHMIEEVKKLGLDFHELHTSGHADVDTMTRMNEILKPKSTIVIHTEAADKGKEVFDNQIILEDKEEFIMS